MDWGNTAHILETYVQHGGANALSVYLNSTRAAVGRNTATRLKELTTDAKKVFSRMVGAGGMSAGTDWKMGEVVRGAAKRLRDYMKSGAHSKRTYKAATPHHRIPHKREEFDMFRQMYELPTMEDSQFYRLMALPGMRQLVDKKMRGIT